MDYELVEVNPFRCRVWALHDRIEDNITEQNCRAEIESVAAHRQFVPVLGRRICGHPEVDVEIIYGARRLFVARHLNRPLLVELRQLSDREAIVAMDIENRQRTDISPYERGLAYATWLRTGQFSSQQQLAKTLQVSPSQVSRLLALARLPAVILAAFDNPSDIREGWGLELADALADPRRREQLLVIARRIAKATPRPTPEEIFRQLLGSSFSLRRVKRWARDEIVRGRDGLALFRIRQQRTAISFVLPTHSANDQVIDNCRACLTRILEEARHLNSPQNADASTQYAHMQNSPDPLQPAPPST